MKTFFCLLQLYFICFGCVARYQVDGRDAQISGSGSGVDPCELKADGTSGFFRSNRPIDGLIELPTILHRKAFYYGCASQQFNFENRTQPTLMKPESQYLLGMKDVPYWDVGAGNLSPQSRIAKLGNFSAFSGLIESSKKGATRIFVHPFDEAHIKAFQKQFGEPSGTVPGMVTSSFRTLLLLPPRNLPFLIKLSGSVVLGSHFKALLEDEVLASVARSQALSSEPQTFVLDHAGVLFSSEFIPGVHAISQKDDRASSIARVSDTKINRPIYHQLFRSFYALDSRVRDADDWVLLPGHSLFSLDYLQTSSGAYFVGADLAEQRRWINSQIIPDFARFIMQAVFQRGLHLEAHFQNIDFLIVKKGTQRTVYVLYKDLTDIVEDPVLMELLGTLNKEHEVLWFGSWAQGGQPFADIEKKYAGKFGLLKQSELFNHHPDMPGSWAKVLHQALLDAYRSTTTQLGLSLQDVLLEPELNARIYQDFQMPDPVAEQSLGKLIATMREHVLKVMLHKDFQKTADQSSQAKLEFLKRADPLVGKGAERNCSRLPTWNDNIASILEEYELGDVQKVDAPNHHKIKALLKRGHQKVISCYVILSSAKPREVSDFPVVEDFPVEKIQTNPSN